MIYELRKYVVERGRMQDMHERMAERLPPLLDRHGIRVVGRWSALAGPVVPLFCYLMAWHDFAEREAAWGGFYADPDWARVRAETNAGSELVESYELDLLRLHPAFEPSRNAPPVVGGLHQLIVQRIAPGQGPGTVDFLRCVVLPCLRREGATIVGVLDTLSGPALPNVVILAAWPDETTWFRGWRAVIAGEPYLDACQQQRETIGRTLFGPAEIHLLEPASYALPVGSLDLRIV